MFCIHFLVMQEHHMLLGNKRIFGHQYVMLDHVSCVGSHTLIHGWSVSTL